MIGEGKRSQVQGFIWRKKEEEEEDFFFLHLLIFALLSFLFLSFFLGKKKKVTFPKMEGSPFLIAPLGGFVGNARRRRRGPVLAGHNRSRGGEKRLASFPECCV